MTLPPDDEVLESGSSRPPNRWLWPVVVTLLVVVGVIGFVLHGDGSSGRSDHAGRGSTGPSASVATPSLPDFSTAPPQDTHTSTACPPRTSCRPTSTSTHARTQVLAAIDATLGRVDHLSITTIGEHPRDRSCAFYDRRILATLPDGGSVRAELSAFDPSGRLMYEPVQGQHRVFANYSFTGGCYVYVFATVSSDATVIGHHMSDTDALIAQLSADTRLAAT